MFEYVPKDVVVYVPAGTVETYSAAKGWNYFSDFREISDTGVSKLPADNVARPVDIYNTQGMLVKTGALQSDIDALAPGLYIIGERKVLVR